MGKNIIFNFRRLVFMDTGKISRCGLLLVFSVALTACNTMNAAGESETSADAEIAAANVADDVTGKEAKPVTAVDASSANEKADAAGGSSDSNTAAAIKKEPVNLDGDTLFNLLAAEFAGNAGDV